MAVTLKAINTGIHDTLRDNISTVNFTQDYDDLTEGLANTPVLQVYWSEMPLVSRGSDTHQSTFGGSGTTSMKHKEFIFIVDVYLDPRAHIDQVYGTMMDIVDDINDVFEAQNAKPYFGVNGIEWFQFSCENIGMEYAGILYPLVRWTIPLGVF